MRVSVPKVRFRNPMPKPNVFLWRGAQLTTTVLAILFAIPPRSVFALTPMLEMIADVIELL